MTYDKLFELQEAYREWNDELIDWQFIDQIPTEIADRAIEALKELTEMAKHAD